MRRMNTQDLIAKYQSRAAEYHRQAEPYVTRKVETAKYWLARALEAEEIVRDLQEQSHAMQRVPAKARGRRTDSQESTDTAEAADGLADSGVTGDSGTE